MQNSGKKRSTGLEWNAVMQSLRGITVTDSNLRAQYLFLDSRDVTLERVEMWGKYSFQYMEDLTIRKLTHKNPTMKQKFDEARARNSQEPTDEL